MLWLDPEEAGFVAVPGGRIWYRLNGAKHRGRRAFVGINGGPGMSHHYMIPLVELADEYPVVFYDQLDTGNADRPNDPANWVLDRFVAELVALREALGLERVVILGHSFGAMVLIDYVLSGPSGLEGMVLASPCLSARRWEADATALVAALPDDIREVIRECEASGDTDNEDFTKAVRTFGLRHICRADPRPDFVVRSFSLFGSPLYNAMWGPSEFSVQGSLKNYERTSALKDISTRTLITCGEYDEATPAACHEFAALMPDASVVVVPDASHFTFAEQPDEYVAAVRKFLADLPSA